VDWDLDRGRFELKVPLDELVQEVIKDLVRVCVVEYRDNHLTAEQIGKRESSYERCYDKVEMHLLKRNRL